MGAGFWWIGRPEERFWFYRFGVDSLAEPKFPVTIESVTQWAGRQFSRSRTLMKEVRPGDEVLLWAEEPLFSESIHPDGLSAAFVGIARAESAPRVVPARIDIWNVHPSELDMSLDVETVEVDLCDHCRLDVPVTLQNIRECGHKILEMRDRMKQEFKSPLFIPWTFSPQHEIGIADGETLKLPLENVRLLGLHERPKTVWIPEPHELWSSDTELLHRPVDQWRNRRLKPGESFPINKLSERGLDTLVSAIVAENRGAEVEHVVSAVQRFLGIKRRTVQLGNLVALSLQRIRAETA